MNTNTLQKVYSGKARTKAVHLFCHECMGYDKHRNGNASVGYVEAGLRVRDCEATRCPLYPYRRNEKDPVTPSWIGAENGSEH